MSRKIRAACCVLRAYALLAAGLLANLHEEFVQKYCQNEKKIIFKIFCLMQFIIKCV